MSKTVKVLRPTGRLDVTSAPKFRRDVADIVATQPKLLVIDLQDVNFMDSSGLGALVSAIKSVRTIDGELVVCSLTEQVKMLFELTSMSKIFKTYASVEEFYQKSGLSPDAT